MKATGIMCVETRDHIFAVRWGDCGWAYLVDGENGPIAHILKPNNTKTLDSPTIGTTQAAHDLTLTDHEREIESASARIIITKSYNDGGKFNRPDGAGVGVIGYKGDFDKYIEAFGVEKPKKGIFTHCSWTDGFVLLCHLCGITQPWVAAAVLHQFSFGEGKKLSYTPTQILVLYALNKMSQGWVPDDHEYRNKFDDMSLVVSSRNPNIFDLPDTTGEIGNLRTLIQDYPYLAKEAERRIQQITLKKNS